MTDQQHCINCLREAQGFYTYPCQHCGWSPDQHGDSGLYLSPGTILDNRYQIGKMLGHGGFGITYLAWDNNLETKLAIKEYMPRDFATRNSTHAEVSTFAGDAKENFAYGLERFLDEARTLAKFQQHAGIVSVLNFFKENGTGYMAMEYVDGLTLKEYLADKDRLSWEQTLGLFMPVMDALREVHKIGIMHRDISPDNIYLCAGNRIKLLDFGSSRYALGGHSRSLSVVVKPGYAPEEQYRAKGKQGAWTDVYSVAASMYRCVTGLVPPDALDRLDRDELVLPSKLGVQLPADVERALMAALAIKAETRTQSIAVFQQALWKKATTTIDQEPPAVTQAEAVKPAMVSHDHALDAYNQGDFEQALSLFQAAADQGDAGAQNYLGFMYAQGQGVQQDYALALQWYLKAAEQGHAHAQYRIGVLYEKGQGVEQDDEDAVQWYQDAADSGYTLAQASLKRLREPLKEKTIKHKAAYREPKQRGRLTWYWWGGATLGLVLLVGLIVAVGQKSRARSAVSSAMPISAEVGKPLEEEAKTIASPVPTKHSAVQDNNEIKNKADTFYSDGLYKLALPLYQQLAELGNADAQANLGKMYDNGQGVTEDAQQAVQWFRKAAEQGDARAQSNLGAMYAVGRGVTQDDQQAVQWFRKAAEQGYARAQSNLGAMYVKGRGVTQDDQQAVQWFRKAAEQGDAYAQTNLGRMYENGQGVTQDAQQAVQWYRKAANQGNADAIKALKNIHEKVQAKVDAQAQAQPQIQAQAQAQTQAAAFNLGDRLSYGGIVFYVDSSGNHGGSWGELCAPT